jgi:TPR repeat
VAIPCYERASFIKPDEAVTHYQEALTIEPEYAEAYYKTGQTISGHQLAQLTDPAFNNLNNVIFTAYVKAPIGFSTFFVGLFSPEAQIAPIQDHPIPRASLRTPSTMRTRSPSYKTPS